VALDERVVVVDHPLVAHHLRHLRDASTTNADFLRTTGELSKLLAYEALRGIELSDVVIDTPVAAKVSAKVIDQEFLVVPILRAGLGMIPAVQATLPRSRVCLVGVRRDERTLKPTCYYDGLPDDVAGDRVVVCDPMCATGGSLIAVVDLLRDRGAMDVTVLCLIAAVPGLSRFLDAHPTARVITAALDPALDARGYIVPGLGDAGDRLFGAPPA
jgi:uracil phosphoribosyltransferase